MSFIWGFGIGLSLIAAIGAQNAFVLRQGLVGDHRLAVCLCCAVSDLVLISAGVAGFGALGKAMPFFVEVMQYGGALFVLAYAAFSFRSAIVRKQGLLPDDHQITPRGRTLATCLALTWLNPHVYVDTLILLGSIAATYGSDRFVFGAGAVCASFVFFFALGYGAKMLRPVFARPAAWKILDGMIALFMAFIGAQLMLG